MILKTISWSLIYNEGAPLSEVVRRLHDKSIKDVLRVITTLCNVINQVDFDNINQDALAQGYLPENVYVELKRSVDLKKEVLFCLDGLRLLFQFACLSCSPGTASEINPLELNKLVGEAYLMICDYLDPDVDLEAFDKTSDDSIAMLVHSYESRFNGRLDFLTLARCKSIWIDALASAETTEVLGKVLEQFKSHYSVSVFQLISVATACLARFSSNAKPFLLNPRTYFQACSNVEECLAAVKLLSLNQGEFAAKLIRTSRHCWSTDISVLKRYPFLQLNESEFICFDIGLLNQFLIDGIYWLLSETASKLGLDFKAVFGSQVFSRYVEKVIEEFAYSGEVLHKQFYKSPFAVGGNEELGDGIFYADDLACVCEYKSGFLTPQQKYSWNSTSILSGIDQMVCSNKKGAKKGAGQLAQAIETLFSDGKYTCEGRVVDFDCSSEVLPIIIVQDTCLSMSFIQKRVREKFRDFLNPDLRPKVKDLIVLSTSDLELFVELRQNKKEVLIAFLDFLSRNESKLQGDFTTFVYVHYHNHFSSDDSFRKRQGKEHLDEVCEGLGLVKTW